MRRIGLIVLVLAAGGAGAMLIGASAQGSSSARFDVIFDNARGLIGGQLVKVAGARAGTIQNVIVTPDFKARVEATIDSRFMPFRQNATCAIRPEGLIAENYIDCDPGSAGSPPLRSVAGHPPTVPVTHTTEPVSILDLFNIFNLPTRERFQLIINELGIGTSGRGEDFNQILLRANPALAEARKVISILANQQKQLATIVEATNKIAAEGAGHTANVQRFLDQAASLSALTAAHADPLSQSIARLPGLLAAARPALQTLDTVASEGTPVLAQIHAAVPALNQVSADFGPFVRTAKPALASLNVALQHGIPDIEASQPLVNELSSYVSRSLPSTLQFAKLAANLQQRGFVENFLSVTYYIGASLARFDANSHLLAILLVGPHNGACTPFALTPVAGCSAHYGSAPAFKPLKASADRIPARSPSAHRAHQPRGPDHKSAPRQATGSTSSTAQAPAAATAPQQPSLPSAPVAQTTEALHNLVNYLVK